MDPTLLLNLGYALNLVALTVKDVLWLRVVLVPAQVLFLYYGVMLASKPAVFWNIVFIAINTVRIARLIRERRPIELPPDLLELYEKCFSEMKRREFLLFWETGSLQTVRDELMVKEGERPEALLFLVSGAVRIESGGRSVATLARGSFVAELSFLTQEPASADVIAEGEVEFNSWNQRKLRRLSTINPDLYHKIQRILSRDMTEKLKTASQRMREQNDSVPEGS